MGIERESFVGNPNKQEYIEDDYDELAFISDDEMELNPMGLPMGDPDLIVIHDLPDMATDDEDDDDYNPAEDYEIFLSDTDYDYDYDTTGEGPSDEPNEDSFEQEKSSSEGEETNYESENQSISSRSTGGESKASERSSLKTNSDISGSSSESSTNT